MYFLAIVGLLSTVIAAFYYLRLIKIIYFDTARDKYENNHNIGLKLSLLLSSIFILFYFIYPSWLTEIIEKINII
jgi:NADH-quinone oxidoreductase subunit N